MSGIKKVLYITYDGLTDPLGQSQVLPYIVGLSRSGYKFVIISFEKKKRFSKQSDIIAKITKDADITWVPLSFSSKPPLIAKIWDVFKMKRKIKALVKHNSFDLIHCRSYVPVSACLSISRKKAIPYLFDMRGFWVDERVDNGQWNLRNPFFKVLYKYYKKREQIYFNKAAYVVSLTDKGRDELIRKYNVPADRVSTIPCCVDLAHFHSENISVSEKEEIRRAIGLLPGQKVISYLGSLGGWYLTEEMLDFFVLFQKANPEYIFLFITQDNEEKINSMALSKGINRESIFVRPASREMVPKLLSISNWSIFFIKNAYSKIASSPTKQGEIMAMGIPVICNDIGDTGSIIQRSKAGIVVNNLNTDSYLDVIQIFKDYKTVDSNEIRNGAFCYFDLSKGIDDYNRIYAVLTS